MKKIEKLEDVKELFKRSKIKIFGLGGNPLARSEACLFCDDAEIICMQESGEIDSVREKIEVRCFPKKQNPIPYAVKKPEELLRDENVIEYIKNKSHGFEKVGIYLYKPTFNIEKICEENNWVVIGTPSELFNKIDSRDNFFEIMKESGYEEKFLECKIDELGSTLNKAYDYLGERLVVQMVAQGGGRGTFFVEKINHETAISEIKLRIGKFKNKNTGDNLDRFIIREFFDGPSLSASGCVTKNNGVLVSTSQYQLIDVKEAILAKDDAVGIFCGHDWSISKNIPLSIRKKIDEMIIAVGKVLKEKGYLGIFGLDFIYDSDNDRIIPIEINPRLVGTLPTFAHLQALNNEIPLVAIHCLEYLEIDYKISQNSVYNKEIEKEGAHLLLFNPLKSDIVVGKEIKGGVYSYRDGEIGFVKNGLDVEDIKDLENEFIITDGIPKKSVVIGGNRKIVKLIFGRGIVDDNLLLSDWSINIVEKVYQELNIKKYLK